jgi:hypothetical protein
MSGGTFRWAKKVEFSNWLFQGIYLSTFLLNRYANFLEHGLLRDVDSVDVDVQVLKATIYQDS